MNIEERVQDAVDAVERGELGAAIEVLAEVVVALAEEVITLRERAHSPEANHRAFQERRAAHRRQAGGV